MTSGAARGRPLGVVAVVVASYVAGRGLVLSQSPPVAVQTVAISVSKPGVPDRTRMTELNSDASASPALARYIAQRVDSAALATMAAGPPVAARSITLSKPAEAEQRTSLRDQAVVVSEDRRQGSPPVLAAPNVASLPASKMHERRFSGSFWAIGRGGGRGDVLADAGQLGGSQTGVRLWWAATPTVALTARASTPFGSQSGREVAVGVGLRHRNIGVMAERRFAVAGGGRDATVVTAFGGFDSVALPAQFRLDGYAQAGIAASDGFIDASLRAERMVATIGRVRLSAGAGAWGAAQPNVARFDIGPQIVARIPVGDRAARLSVEWRERVAGHAAPSSGPVVTLGTDF